MRILIIGGTGLISTAITRLLVATGHKVTLFNRGRREAPAPERVRQVHGDRYDYGQFEARMRELGHFEVVIEMIGFQAEDAQSLIRAFGGRCDQLIFTSTVDVYAKPATHYPILESEPQRPNNDYGRGKSECERILMDADREGQFHVTIIRPAMTYGESGGLVDSFGWGTTFIDRMRKGKPIISHGDGTSLWVACHREDAANAFVNACGNEAAHGQAYHVTGDQWMAWDHYLRRIARAAQAPEPELVHIPTELLVKAVPRRAAVCRDNFAWHNIFDNTAAREDLGFRYTVRFVTGARRTIEWLDQNDGIEASDDEEWYDRLIDAYRRLGEEMAEEFH